MTKEECSKRNEGQDRDQENTNGFLHAMSIQNDGHGDGNMLLISTSRKSIGNLRSTGDREPAA